MEHTLAELLLRFTYPAILVVLAAAGLGVPISEDLVLLLGGTLAAQGVTAYWPTLATGYLGVILGDVLIYHWGIRLGPRAYEHRLVRRVLSEERKQRLCVHFARHGFWTVVVGRHTPGLRAPIFFLSGASGVGPWKFLVADMLSAAVTVPIVVTLGYEFGEHLPEIRRLMHRVEWALAAAVVVALAIYLTHRRRKRRQQSLPRAPEAAAPRDVRESSG
ncbi:MAG TPA: DedA family protein [Myxococcales bacterium]|nr:DedA family protein [Myxococcales bacterium]